jgi:hypothetical protein
MKQSLLTKIFFPGRQRVLEFREKCRQIRMNVYTPRITELEAELSETLSPKQKNLIAHIRELKAYRDDVFIKGGV